MPIRGIPSLNAVASFTEPSSSGGKFDPDAARNAPLKDPAGNLSNVHFHSDFDYYELAYGPATVNVNHTALSGYTGPDIGIAQLELHLEGQQDIREYTLVTHNLGYVPRYFVAYNGSRLGNGQMVQNSGGFWRIVAPFATSSIIGLREWLASGSSSLAGVTRSYEVMVFANPSQTPSLPLMGFDGSDLVLGRGRIRSSKRYLRRVKAGESSFDINRDVTMDVTNGRIKIVSGGNAYTEPGYDGSFSGPSYVAVGGGW